MTGIQVLTPLARVRGPLPNEEAGHRQPPAARDRRGRDRGRSRDQSRDRTGQRAAAMLMLEGMYRLKPSDPEREELRRQVIAEYMPFARNLSSRYATGGQLAEDLCQEKPAHGLPDGAQQQQPAAFATWAGVPSGRATPGGQ